MSHRPRLDAMKRLYLIYEFTQSSVTDRRNRETDISVKFHFLYVKMTKMTFGKFFFFAVNLFSNHFFGY